MEFYALQCIRKVLLSASKIIHLMSDVCRMTENVNKVIKNTG